MKNYIKPEVKINPFISEDVINTSGTSTPVTNPEQLARSGYSIGKIDSLFND